jgi:competence protein ComEC
VIWTTTYPLVSSVFGAVPLAGLFVNIIAVPAFAFILPAIALCALMALSGMPFSGVAVNAANYVLAGWEQLCNFIALLVPYGVEWSLPFAVIALNSGCLMLLRAINVPWSRVLIFIMAGNLIVTFISATVVV